MTEPLLGLLERTEAALRAVAAACRSDAVASPDPLMLDMLEGVAQQFEDRAEQCASWAFYMDPLNFSVTSGLEAIMRDACAEFLRMVGKES